MAKLTDDADYDAGETFENVSSPQSDARNQDNYYGRRLRTRCVLHSLLGCCKLPTTMPAKRLRMYQVHCQMLGIKTMMPTTRPAKRLRMYQVHGQMLCADYDAGETFENVSSPLSDAGNQDDDADYEAGETSENVSSPRSDASYYGRRLRTRCVLHGLPENKNNPLLPV
ncbi:unnamed protein product [Protopolystoma xenopodis]|uniref:Uncharacterized protein n=1 Tax=Protopolystoma xenopodis TaxID=117903 RepID=A0A3S5AGW0_9PLAT|nr:unnamed protein product [Protopolystoma xenopodis]